MYILLMDPPDNTGPFIKGHNERRNLRHFFVFTLLQSSCSQSVLKCPLLTRFHNYIKYSWYSLLWGFEGEGHMHCSMVESVFMSTCGQMNSIYTQAFPQ